MHPAPRVTTRTHRPPSKLTAPCGPQSPKGPNDGVGWVTWTRCSGSGDRSDRLATVLSAAIQEMEVRAPDDVIRQSVDNFACLMPWADGASFVRWAQSGS